MFKGGLIVQGIKLSIRSPTI